MGLSFESLIGQQIQSHREQLVSTEYLHSRMTIANERFVENTKRIGRFREALRDLSRPQPTKKNLEGEDWEDAAARRERKRAEGLRRKAEMQNAKRETPAVDSDEAEAVAQSLSGF